jgi:hypothetical protein
MTSMDMIGNILPNVFNENAQEDRGENARL